MKSAIFFAAVAQVGAVSLRNADQACMDSDLKMRQEFQAKLKGVCEDMCKEVGAYPNCAQCPDFEAPDSTPGVMTWEELLEHMDNLSEWGHEEIKGWHAQAKSFVQFKAQEHGSCKAQQKAAFALVEDHAVAMGVPCEEMCKRIGVYPKCQCPGFDGAPADTDGRSCVAACCQDPSNPCPNDAFLTCVEEKSATSFAQLMKNVDSGFTAVKMTRQMEHLLL